MNTWCIRPRGAEKIFSDDGPLRLAATAVALGLALSWSGARADLTDELCGSLANLAGGGETLNGEGVRTRFHIDTVEGRIDPVPHCFMDGTLAGDTRYRVLLPQAWNGKFVLGLGGGYGGNVNANHDFVTVPVVTEGYAFASSNEGRQSPVFDPADNWQELHYIRNHQTTQFAQGKIAQLYGAPPSRSYLFGSSGGGWRSLAQLERYPHTYDGAGIRNPVIEPRNFAYQYSLLDKNLPVFIDKLPEIIQARDRGEDPFALLDPEEAAALQNMYDGGATIGSEFRFSPRTDSLTVILGYPVFPVFDPTYLDDFWTQPGYAGFEGEVDDQVIEGITGSVSEAGAPNANQQIFSFTDTANPYGTHNLKGWRITFTSGALAGEHFHINSNSATQINVAGFRGPLNGLEPGDTYTLSNRDFLAWRDYHFHIAECEFPEYAPVCDSSGRPLRVQRPQRVQQAFKTKLATFSGRISAPVVSTAQALDELVYAPVIQRYFDTVRNTKGKGDMLRVYWFENTGHGSPSASEVNRLVERESSWHKAFQLMVRWVEEGVSPPADTVVDVTPGVITFPEAASDRKGLQPTISATANGGALAVVPAGSPVAFDGFAGSPIGNVAKYEWDFESDNNYDCDSDPSSALPDCAGPLTPASEVNTPAVHAYGAPGTYVATVRVTDDTDNPGPFDGLENLDRVVVEVQ